MVSLLLWRGGTRGYRRTLPRDTCGETHAESRQENKAECAGTVHDMGEPTWQEEQIMPSETAEAEIGDWKSILDDLSVFTFWW